MKAKRKISLAAILYPAAVIAGFLYMWLSGEYYLAIVESAVGTAGAAYGWACK